MKTTISRESECDRHYCSHPRKTHLLGSILESFWGPSSPLYSFLGARVRKRGSKRRRKKRAEKRSCGSPNPGSAVGPSKNSQDQGPATRTRDQDQGPGPGPGTRDQDQGDQGPGPGVPEVDLEDARSESHIVQEEVKQQRPANR